ncbi:uncharacterized protein LOC126680140 [Mercurialis annua]|uniref:uncharacterized protein LOC126680140 n=1 Tax=Mercurialis annua TaxID=3986 RepID=UPI00215E943F|nr:uncharacterized protein LOC126680140 [Mercurialis annua]
MVLARRKREPDNENDGGGGGGSGGGGGTYEELREQRIKENKERLEKLGILKLALNLRPTKPTTDKKKKPHNPTLLLSDSPRRSSRLKTMTTVNYTEKVAKTKKGESEDVEIRLGEGSKPEIYKEEDEKLLGDCKMGWTLLVDGYGRDGKRIYDPVRGETCHQCRQKTLGRHTYCYLCDSGQGQFCGDCLYMRYGENVMEVNKNPDWICPVCRGICNCSRCRKTRGWAPTGQIYKKVKQLGFKSVAHYLIQTRKEQFQSEGSDVANMNSGGSELALVEKESQSDKDVLEMGLKEKKVRCPKVIYVNDDDSDDDDDNDDDSDDNSDDNEDDQKITN